MDSRLRGNDMKKKALKNRQQAIGTSKEEINGRLGWTQLELVAADTGMAGYPMVRNEQYTIHIACLRMGQNRQAGLPVCSGRLWPQLKTGRFY